MSKQMISDKNTKNWIIYFKQKKDVCKEIQGISNDDKERDDIQKEKLFRICCNA